VRYYIYIAKRKGRESAHSTAHDHAGGNWRTNKKRIRV